MSEKMTATVDSSRFILAILLRDRRELNTIKSLMAEAGIAVQYAQVAYTRDYKNQAYRESDQTLFVMTEEDLKKAQEADFNIHPYDFEAPRVAGPNEGEERNIHFRGFPREWRKEEIESHLLSYAELFIDPVDVECRIKCVDGVAQGFGELVFKPKVPLTSIKSIMALIGDQPVTESHVVRCSWSKVKSRSGKTFSKVFLQRR